MRFARILLVVSLLLAGCNLAAVTPPAATSPPLPTAIPTFTLAPTEPPTSTPLPPPTSILFLGDSITQGWNVETHFPGAVNAGRNSDLSGQVVIRYLDGYSSQPFDAIVVQVGINDIVSGVSDDTLRENLMTLTMVLQPDTDRIVLGSLLPVNPAQYGTSVARRVVEMNNWLRDFAAAQGFVFVDFYAAMSDDQGLPLRGLLSDGLHPSARGYALMSEVLTSALQ